MADFPSIFSRRDANASCDNGGPNLCRTFFRAGHAHAGVLLLYHTYMEQTNLSPTTKMAGAITLLIGILAQSGGFLLHMAIGQPDTPSRGTTITSLGAALLAVSILILVYGLITTK